MKQLITALYALTVIMGCTSSKKATTPDASLKETYWKLTELMGKPVVTTGNQKEAHMILKNENSRVNGNGGCNIFNGTYSLKDPNRISFSQMAITQMACMNMETESQLLKVLDMADSYYIKGDTLQLIRARMAPLAKFQAVYLR